MQFENTKAFAQKSMYSFPSASQTLLPLPLVMKRGVPPTLPKALTGLFTPPGKSVFAFSNNCSDFFVLISLFEAANVRLTF